MSSYHIDQLGRVVELKEATDRSSCSGCMYGDALTCISDNERPRDANNQRTSCRIGIFVEVVHD